MITVVTRFEDVVLHLVYKFDVKIVAEADVIQLFLAILFTIVGRLIVYLVEAQIFNKIVNDICFEVVEVTANLDGFISIGKFCKVLLHVALTVCTLFIEIGIKEVNAFNNSLRLSLIVFVFVQREIRCCRDSRTGSSKSTFCFFSKFVACLVENLMIHSFKGFLEQTRVYIVFFDKVIKYNFVLIETTAVPV